MMNTKARLILVAVILGVVTAIPLISAQAQTPAHLSQMTIRLWPEYDRPGVLVFYSGQVADNAFSPVALTFPLPEDANVNAVAYIEADSGSLSDDVLHSVAEDSVSITSPNGSFHIEFYDPALTIDQQKRSYRFTWQSDLTIDRLTWEVQQPIGATGFVVEPGGGTTNTEENGLGVYQLDMDDVAAGQVVTITVTYDKQTTMLTTEMLQGNRRDQIWIGLSPLVPMVAGVAAAVLISAVIAIRLCGGFEPLKDRLMRRAPSEERERKPRGRAAKKLGKKPEPGERYCPQCGQPAVPGDVFCRNCGTNLHS
jgi:hypothetical protein